MSDTTAADSLLASLTASVQAITSDEKQAAVADLSAARVMVAAEIGTYTVPDAARDKAVLEVASDLYFRRSARNGIVSVTDTDMQPFRINRDPLASARPILRPFMPSGLGIA